MNANALYLTVYALKIKKGINIHLETKNALKTKIKGVIYGIYDSRARYKTDT